MTFATTPQILAFPDRKEDGQFPVRGPDGQPVAHIAARWTGVSFTATDASGGPLCAGSVRRGGLSRKWTARGPGGRPLLRVTMGWTGSKAEVVLERGGSFQLRGSAWRRDFTVSRSDRAMVVSAVPRTAALSFHPNDYLVRQAEPVFDLAELVALVQIWRMLKRNASAAAAGSAGA